MPDMSRPRRRRILFWTALIFLALLSSIATGEGMLRVIYRDQGRATLGGPGAYSFEYTYNPAGPGPEARHPLSADRPTPGVTRVAIQGDSITWGSGVKDWTRLYPSRLLERLSAAGGRYDIRVQAAEGYGLHHHADHLPRLVDAYAPDVLVYQWYANDLDIHGRAQVERRPWQNWPYHDATRNWSYLYFFLDNRFDRLMAQPYERHLIDDFHEGSHYWSFFRDAFHRWATVASSRVARTIVLLYPQVPFRGENPLGEMHARLAALTTGSSRMEYPPSVHGGEVGELRDDPTARAHVIRHVDGKTGLLSSAGDIPMLAGHYVVDFRVRLDAPAEHPGHVRVVDHHGTHVLADLEIPHDAVGEWVDVNVAFDIPGDRNADDVEFQVAVDASASVSTDTIGLAVSYPGLEVLDPTAALNTFDTHASLFDAHPNERAHGVLADLLFERLRAPAPPRPRVIP